MTRHQSGLEIPEGHTKEDYLYSVRVDRKQWSATGLFKPVEPLLLDAQPN